MVPINECSSKQKLIKSNLIIYIASFFNSLSTLDLHSTMSINSIIHMTCVAAAALTVFIAQQVSPDSVPFTPIVNAAERRAVCLDGSPAGYYFAAGGSGNWLVYLAGGGWCHDNATCQSQRNFLLGSTKHVRPLNFKGILSNHHDINPDFYNWNRIYVYYCDQSSFLGDTQIVDQGPNLQFRGSRIFDAVIDDLVAKGMDRGKNAILAGASAGGLATILQCDRFRDRLPAIPRLKCIADSGFFLRAKDLPNADVREQLFASTIKFHNLSSFLPTSCTQKRDPGLCFFSEYLVENVRTPLFLLNSVFDQYEIQNNLEPLDSPDFKSWQMCVKKFPSNCTATQNKLIEAFGCGFLQTIMGVPDSESRGLFINTYFVHVFTLRQDFWNPNSTFKVENMNLLQAVSNWYFERRSVKLIDDRKGFPQPL